MHREHPLPLEGRTGFHFSALLVGLLGLLMLAACGVSASTTPAATPPASAPPQSTMALAASTPNLPIPSLNPSVSPAATAKPTPSGVPSFSHIYIIVMENREYDALIGSPSLPYLNSLVAQYGLATNYTGVAHPSEPNYFALFSGSTQGASDDGVYNIPGQNLADQIEAAGKTWRVFAENVPPDCFIGPVATGGADGPGTYARKHEPAISFTNISSSQVRCANITDFTHFDPEAANYELISPNMCHDMHDCASTVGDNFLAAFVPKILKSSAWQVGGVLFITWDEGSSGIRGGGRVPLLVIAQGIKRSFQSSAAYSHYSLVRTVEDAWGMSCLNLACQANNLSAFFQ